MVIRSTKTTTTGYTPSELRQGYVLRTPATNHGAAIEDGDAATVEQMVDTLQNTLSEIRQDAEKRQHIAKKKASSLYDKKVRRLRAKVGDRALVEVVGAEKFRPEFEGPYTITAVRKHGAIEIQDTLGNRDVVAANRLRRYEDVVNLEEIAAPALASSLRRYRVNANSV